ncbi:efflux RND transporter periplasmic adaptor subunit [Massilia sp. R2A-15]|uniref:efflux RND transporter periplasmic adaptor subunit n=1 Tax=Massilia sp. R2A-15 TaxID=3064278 RepID=UPI00273390D0|nr:efflux RND transporter periplasmic adaptor subunit [Massilia sp. R2A-15]WLI88126.1 efflux RND transporter periplasmic adaptor subunit [Massilia sp. R2A-15]
MRRKLIAATLIGAVLAAPLAFKFSRGKSGRAAELMTVKNLEIRPSILATGNLVFHQEVQLSPEVIGKIAEVNVREGDKVTKGQLLMRLDSTGYLTEVAQQEASCRNAAIAIERAEINLANQRRNLERAQRLYKDKFIDVSRFDGAAHQVALAKVELRVSRETREQASAMLSRAREQLAKTEVRAPINGTVTVVSIKVGETAVASATGIAGSSLMTIADVGSMMAEVNVDEADIARVGMGQTARVYPAAFSGQPVAGKVVSVAMAPRAAAPGAPASQGHSYVVKLQLDDPGLALRSGMTCRVEIVVGAIAPKPAVPIQALLSEAVRDGKERIKNVSYVFAVADGRATKKVVELGVSDDINQEVVTGLRAGEIIAVGPARVLRDLHEGDRVSAQRADVALASGRRP